MPGHTSSRSTVVRRVGCRADRRAAPDADAASAGADAALLAAAAPSARERGTPPPPPAGRIAVLLAASIAGSGVTAPDWSPSATRSARSSAPTRRDSSPRRGPRKASPTPSRRCSPAGSHRTPPPTSPTSWSRWPTTGSVYRRATRCSSRRAWPPGAASSSEKSGGGEQWKFETPRGRLVVQRKDIEPAWVPPDWHYEEAAQKRKLGLQRLEPGRASPRPTGAVVTVSGANVVTRYPDAAKCRSR